MVGLSPLFTRGLLIGSLVTGAGALMTSGCSEHLEATITPAQQKKVDAHLLSEAPTPKFPIGAIIEDQVKLIGLDLDRTEFKPGDQLTVTWYIEALVDGREDNMLFVHLQGRPNDSQAWMNLDHHPVEGLLPLRKLKKGQIVKDVQTFTIRPDFTPGDAGLYWGLWRGNHRLKISNIDAVPHDKEGRVLGAKVKIKGDPRAKPKLPSASATALNPGETITLDGQMNEAAWSRAVWTPYWTDPRGRGAPSPKTRARFLWSDTHLYVGVFAEDEDVWSDFTDRDSNTWEQEVIELFIDADGDAKDYLELQVTPANVVFDARFARHRSDLATARAWNMKGFETAVHVDGTVNKRDDRDRSYSVEMAIPIAEVPGAMNPLAHGQHWRVNLFRWDKPKSGRQVASAFSPPIVPDFHALKRFGRLNFVKPQ
ncbi:MAG: carbohydrate-binding family 9-like protein [Bradymonadia bacterium]